MEPHNFKFRTMKYNIIKKYFSFVLVLAVMLLFTSCESVQDKFDKLKELADKSFAMRNEMQTEDASKKDLNKWVKRWEELRGQMEKVIDVIPEDAEFPDAEMNRITEGYQLTVGMGHICKFGVTMKHLSDNFQTYSASDWEDNAKEIENISSEAKKDKDNGLIRNEEWTILQTLAGQYQQIITMAATIGLGETGQLN